MNLENHINKLLYSYDCVIAPGFGAFLTNKNASTVKGNSIYPPSKSAGFNEILQKSDGLLFQTYAQSYGLKFEDAQREVENQISFWKNHLDKNNSLVLNKLGTFTKNSTGNLEFTPNGQNYLLQSFGFESLSTRMIMQTPAETGSSNGIWWKAASVIPILIGGYLYFAQPQPVANFVNEQWSGFVAPIVNPQPEKEIVRQPDTKTITEISVVKAESIKKEINDYQVIAGSFRVLSEAETLESKLKNKGFENAKFTQKKGSYYYVAFETFTTKEEALEYRRVLEKEYPETWVLSLKD